MTLMDAAVSWSSDGPKNAIGLDHEEAAYPCLQQKTSLASKVSAGHPCLSDAPLEREAITCEPFAGITSFAYSLFLMFAGNEAARFNKSKEQHVRFDGEATLRASPAEATMSSSSLGSALSIRDVSDSSERSQHLGTRVVNGEDLCDAECSRETAVPSDVDDIRRQLEADLDDGNPRHPDRGDASIPMLKEDSSRTLVMEHMTSGVDNGKERDGEEEGLNAPETAARSRLGSFTAEAYVPTTELCERLAQRTGNFSKVEFKDLNGRMAEAVAPASSLARPNYSDMLKRVSVVIYSHMKTCEMNCSRTLRAQQKAVCAGRTVCGSLAAPAGHDIQKGRFDQAMAGAFHEKNFIPLKFRYKFYDGPPMALGGGLSYTLHESDKEYKKPSVEEIHEFAKTIFTAAHLSSECSVVCLIYLERAMERAGVPVLATTWRPLLISGLIMASKMWMDYAMYTRELSNAYPEFEFEKLVGLEILFLKVLNWELAVTRSEYARYYYSLRIMNGDAHLRHRYERLLKIPTVPATDKPGDTLAGGPKKSGSKKRSKGPKLCALSRSV